MQTPEIPQKKSPEQDIHERLYAVIDPELNLNIVDLGLIYSISVSERIAKIEMTLTSPGCPIAHAMISAVEQVAGTAPDIDHVEVILVWDPPWDIERIPPEIRRNMGFF